MMHSSSHGHAAQHSRYLLGFSLIEVMVGMVIGMIGIIIMMQMFSLTENRRRTTIGSGDAQANGVIILDEIQRDISQSGYGFVAGNPSANESVIGCTLNLGTAIAPRTVPLVPSIINPPEIPVGDPNTDTLLVAYGNTTGQPQGYILDRTSGNVHQANSPGTLSVGDAVFSAPTVANPCISVLQLTRIIAVNGNDITVQNAVAGTALYNLGQTPQIKGFAIRNSTLTVCDFIANDCSLLANVADPNIWQPIGENIVSLRLEYGHDTTAINAMTGIAVAFNQNPPPTSVPYSALLPNTCGWVRAPVLRVALVARNSQFSRTPIPINRDLLFPDAPADPTGPRWAGSLTTPIDLTLNPDGTANAVWQNYRYSVLEKLIPMRNLVWMGAPTGC
jgi:type IV pilus assembly protein PilW